MASGTNLGISADAEKAKSRGATAERSARLVLRENLRALILVFELPQNRLILTPVKVEVWRRDRGQCVQCGSTKNLHFDHDIPFSKGGSSLMAANSIALCKA